MSAELRNTVPALRRKLHRRAVVDAFAKPDPRGAGAEPGYVRDGGGRVRSILVGCQATTARAAQSGFTLVIAAWLWLTVLFANFSEALAERRGKAQAEALRRARRETLARKVVGPAADLIAM